MNRVFNKIDEAIEKRLLGDKKKLAKYHKEAEKLSKNCDDKYRDERGFFVSLYASTSESMCLSWLRKNR
ncbi:MAG: hypothetical protein WDW20_04180 [Neisseriaceae bacterium]